MTDIRKTTLRGLQAINEVKKMEHHITKMNGELINNVRLVTIVSTETLNGDYGNINPFNGTETILEAITESPESSTLYIDIMYVNNNTLPTIIQFIDERRYDTSITTLVKINNQRYEGETEQNSSEITERIHIFNIDNEVVTVMTYSGSSNVYVDNEDVRCSINVNDNNELDIAYSTRAMSNWLTVREDRDPITPAMYKALFSSLPQLYNIYHHNFDEEY